MADTDGENALSVKSQSETSEGVIPWEPVVQAMYDGMQVERADDDEKWEFKPIVHLGNMPDLSRMEMDIALQYMERSGLVHEPKEGVMALTETGLQIAFDQSTKKRQNRINRTIMLAAIITGLAPALTNWPPENPFFGVIPPNGNAIIVGIGMAIAGVVIMLLLWELYKLEVKWRLNVLKKKVS